MYEPIKADLLLVRRHPLTDELVEPLPFSGRFPRGTVLSDDKILEKLAMTIINETTHYLATSDTQRDVVTPTRPWYYNPNGDGHGQQTESFHERIGFVYGYSVDDDWALKSVPNEVLQTCCICGFEESALVGARSPEPVGTEAQSAHSPHFRVRICLNPLIGMFSDAPMAADRVHNVCARVSDSGLDAHQVAVITPWAWANADTAGIDSRQLIAHLNEIQSDSFPIVPPLHAEGRDLAKNAYPVIRMLDSGRPSGVPDGPRSIQCALFTVAEGPAGVFSVRPTADT